MWKSESNKSFAVLSGEIEEIEEFKELIESSLDPVEVYDNQMFGENYKYTIPLFCAENGYKCMYQPSRILYVIFREQGENGWQEI